MPEEKKKVENAAEKTGGAVGKGIKKGAKAVNDLGKGIKKGIKKDDKESKIRPFSRNKKEKFLFFYVNSQMFN